MDSGFRHVPRASSTALGVKQDPEHLAILEEWLRSYRPEELFNQTGKLIPELAALAPAGDRRMGANPHANGGKLLVDLKLPDPHDFELPIESPGGSWYKTPAPSEPSCGMFSR